jgi:signal peptidase
MEPRIHVGDIVVTRTVPAASLHEGQVVTVSDPDHPGRTRTHRVLRRETGGVLVLKGDANRDADSTRVSVKDVRGVGVVRVPYVGRPATWLAEGNWMALGATALFLGWCVVTVLPASRKRDDMVFA